MVNQSVLSRLAYAGIGKETTTGTYIAPTSILSVSNLVAEDTFAEIRDESLQNNDSVLQGFYQGPGDSDVSFDMLAYPDTLGILLRAIIGPDTITAGVSTTTTAAASAGATTINVTSATGIVTGKIISIGGVTTEYAKVSSVAALVVTLSAPLQYAHASAAAVATQTTHSFKQSNARMPSYSLTEYDGSATNPARGYPGCVMSELDLKIDPKAGVSCATKWMGWPSGPQAAPTTAFGTAAPLLGWQWTMTNGGASSPRGVTLDWAIKREVESIHGSTGTQAPEEIFPGALTVDGTYKARFVDDTDLALFLQNVQQPVTATLTQPTGGAAMGAVLTVTTSQGAWYKGKRNTSGKYLDADFNIYGVSNAVDGGSLSATLSNFTTAAY